MVNIYAVVQTGHFFVLSLERVSAASNFRAVTGDLWIMLDRLLEEANCLGKRKEEREGDRGLVSDVRNRRVSPKESSAKGEITVERKISIQIRLGSALSSKSVVAANAEGGNVLLCQGCFVVTGTKLLTCSLSKLLVCPAGYRGIV